MSSPKSRDVQPAALVPRGSQSPGDDDPRNRVIKVDRAITCCQDSVDQVLQIFDDLATSLVDMPRGFNLALVPGIPSKGQPWTRPRALPIDPSLPVGEQIPAGFTAVGMVVVIASATLEAINQKLGMYAFAEAMIGLSNTVRALNRKLEGSPCEECMMRRALPQSPNKRKRKWISTRKG